MKGFSGAGVLEIVEDFDGNTYRTVYTVSFKHAVYVLHVFQKKSTKGITTPKPDMDLVKHRLQTAKQHYDARVMGKTVMTANDVEIEVSSGNVFADLGFDNAREMLIKSAMAQVIAARIEKLGLTQALAAEILGIDQPKVSCLVRGKLDAFSISRLMRFVTRLGTDVDIVLKDHRGNETYGTVAVKVAC